VLGQLVPALIRLCLVWSEPPGALSTEAATGMSNIHLSPVGRVSCLGSIRYAAFGNDVFCLSVIAERSDDRAIRPIGTTDLEVGDVRPSARAQIKRNREAGLARITEPPLPPAVANHDCITELITGFLARRPRVYRASSVRKKSNLAFCDEVFLPKWTNRAKMYFYRAG